MNYKDLYQRNIGSFTEEEQNKLRNAHVFIAGVGGIGGIQAVNLARMGVGEITIMDPGVYDEPDFNRQYGAMLSTIGKNKAEVMGKLLGDIAPFAKIEVYSRKLSEKELKAEIKRCSKVAINAIDLADFEYHILFSRVARESNKYSMLCPIPDFAAILMTFDPEGMTFEEFTGGKRFPPMTPTAKGKWKRGVIDGNEIPFLSSASSNCVAGSLSGALLATEAALIITEKRIKDEMVFVPYVKYIDLFNGFFKVFNPFNEI